jgi:hypothetical protein
MRPATERPRAPSLVSCLTRSVRVLTALTLNSVPDTARA